MVSKKYLLVFYSSGSSKPIREFIDGVSLVTNSHIVRGLTLLEEFGPRTGMPYVKKIHRKLYELRIRGKEECRLIFTVGKTNIYIVHAFRKKTNKIPPKEIRLSLQRLTKI